MAKLDHRGGDFFPKLLHPKMSVIQEIGREEVVLLSFFSLKKRDKKRSRSNLKCFVFSLFLFRYIFWLTVFLLHPPDPERKNKL